MSGTLDGARVPTRVAAVAEIASFTDALCGSPAGGGCGPVPGSELGPGTASAGR